jgi:hypothetical protein
MTEAVNMLQMQLQTSDMMDLRFTRGQRTPQHPIKVTKGPVPEMLHTCIKKALFHSLFTDIEIPAMI